MLHFEVQSLKTFVHDAPKACSYVNKLSASEIQQLRVHITAYKFNYQTDFNINCSDKLHLHVQVAENIFVSKGDDYASDEPWVDILDPSCYVCV